MKLLFAFREDYLGRVKQLLAARPELVDQALRLGPPPADALGDDHPRPVRALSRATSENELDGALAERLQAALADRFGTGEVSLSEVQTVCLRLWRVGRSGGAAHREGRAGAARGRAGRGAGCACARPARGGDRRAQRDGDLRRDAQRRLRRGPAPARRRRGERIAPALVDEALEPARARVQARAPRAPPRHLPLRDHERVPRPVDQRAAATSSASRRSAGAGAGGCGSSPRSRPLCVLVAVGVAGDRARPASRDAAPAHERDVARARRRRRPSR